MRTLRLTEFYYFPEIKWMMRARARIRISAFESPFLPLDEIPPESREIPCL